MSLTSPPAAAEPSPLLRVAERVAAHDQLRVVAFGSSSTQGVGASGPATTYPAKLQGLLSDALPDVSVTVVNRGIGGQDADDFHARLPTVLADKPDLVIFQTGTNDVLRRLPLERFEALTREDIGVLRSRGIDVLLLEPQDCPVFANTPGAFGYVEAIRRIGAEMDVPVIRRWDLMHDWLARHEATLAELQAGDGLHMADRGYALLARAARDLILTAVGLPVPAKHPITQASR
ncbi:MAG: SGNH/GDSL hydrolase family protein [Acetobacteraceae bacterium]|nr:SGNH/GDSL hydrolase family protein [Acetobacteraceae bacterium]